MARRRRRATQTEIVFHPRGGKRRGAGRKPRGARPLVSHAARAFGTAQQPLLVTLKVVPGIGNLRARRMIGAMLMALAAASDPSQHAAPSRSRFDGWRDREPPLPGVTAAPGTWLLRVGRRKHGLIDPAAVPAPLRD